MKEFAVTYEYKGVEKTPIYFDTRSDAGTFVESLSRLDYKLVNNISIYRISKVYARSL